MSIWYKRIVALRCLCKVVSLTSDEQLSKETDVDIISNQPINSNDGSATLHNPPVDKSKSLSVNTRTDKDVAAGRQAG